jgi:proline iminopeptidase
MRAVAIFILILFCNSAFAQGELQNINGTKLWISSEGKLGGETIVVLHGGPGLNQSYFKPHLDQLAEKFRLIYYDQRASGRSAIPSPDSLTMKFFVGDLEAIREKYGLKKINILAHSWGAVLAVHYALAYPKKVNKIVLSNPAMLSREYDQEAAKIAKSKSTREDSIRRAELMKGPMTLKAYEDFFLLSFKASAFKPENLASLNLDLPENFSEANKALFTGLMKDPAQSRNLYDDLRSIKSKVLIIEGKADIIPQKATQRLHANLPNSASALMDKSGHFPFIEQREEYNKLLAGFFEVKKRK